MRGEKEPTALVLVCEDGVECDVECIGGSCVCLKQRLGVKEGAMTLASRLTPDLRKVRKVLV